MTSRGDGHKHCNICWRLRNATSQARSAAFCQYQTGAATTGADDALSQACSSLGIRGGPARRVPIRTWRLDGHWPGRASSLARLQGQAHARSTACVKETERGHRGVAPFGPALVAAAIAMKGLARHCRRARPRLAGAREPVPATQSLGAPFDRRGASRVEGDRQFF